MTIATTTTLNGTGALAVTSGDLTVNGILDGSDNLSASGNIIINSGATMQGTRTITSGNVTNAGTITGGGIDMTSNGTVTNNTSASITGTVNAVKMAAGGTLTHSSTGAITGGSGDAIVISAGGTVNSTGTGAIDKGSGTNAINITGAGAGVVTLGAATTTTGPILIASTGSANTVDVNAGAVFDNVNISGGSSNTLTLKNGTGDGSCAGLLSAAILNKNDAGTWTLSGNSNFSDTVNVNAGTLTYDTGTLTATNGFTIDAATLNGTGTLSGPVTINSGGIVSGSGPITGATTINTGGTLKGIRTITGLVTNAGGTVSPGNSIGTTTITGDYVQTSGTLLVEVSNTDPYTDLLDVSGSAKFTSGSKIKFINLGPDLGIQQGMVFLKAAGAEGIKLDGIAINVVDEATFYALFDKPPLTWKHFTVDNTNPKQLSLTVSGRHTLESLGDTPVEKTIGAALDTIQSGTAIISGELGVAYQEIMKIDDNSSLSDALALLSPEPLTYNSDVAFDSSSSFLGVMNQHLGATRASYGNTSGPLLAAIDHDPNLVGLALRKTHATQAQKEAWKGFVKAYGNLAHLKSKGGFTGYKSGTGGVAFGFDRFVSSDTIIGVSAGASHGFIDWDRSGSDGHVSGVDIIGYLGYFNENWYWDNALGYGLNYFRNKRQIKVGAFNKTAKSSHVGHAIIASSQVGYGIKTKGSLNIILIGGLQYLGMLEQSFTETGAGTAGMKINSNDVHSLKTNLGVKLLWELKQGEYKAYLPEIFAMWSFETLDPNGGMKVAFLEDSSPTFTVKGRKLNRNSGTAGIGVTSILDQANSYYAQILGQLGDDFYSATLTLGYNFLF